MPHIRIHQFHPFTVHRWYHWLALLLLLILMLILFPSRAGSQEWEVFTTENSPLVNDRIEAIAFDTYGRAWIGTIGGLMRYDDGTWIMYTADNSDLPGNWVTDIAVDSGNHVWVTTISGVGLISGDDWTVYTKENTETGLKNNMTSSVIIDQAGTVWIGTEGSAICTFDGDFWDWHHYNRVPELTGYWINDLHCTASGTVWIATKSGATSFNGTSWTHHGIPVPELDPDSVELRSITSDKYGNACAVTGYGLWKYSGLGWCEELIMVEYESLDGLLTVLFDNSYSAAGTATGLAVEGADGWERYTAENSLLPNNIVTELATGPDGKLWVGTHGGIAVISELSAGVNTEQSTGPQSFITAGPAYPNPFNSATVIPYKLPVSTPVTIELYALNGQHIRTLASGRHTPGRHTAIWDGSDAFGTPAAAGTYFYRIVSPAGIVSGRMVLVK